MPASHYCDAKRDGTGSATVFRPRRGPGGLGRQKNNDSRLRRDRSRGGLLGGRKNLEKGRGKRAARGSTPCRRRENSWLVSSMRGAGVPLNPPFNTRLA